MPSVDEIFSRIQNLFSEICKSKKYLTGGNQPPDGVKMYTGARGGKYYMTEEVHAARGTTPKKRLPLFRKQDSGVLVHNTKTGAHGPGSYKIHQQGGKHHLTFTSKDGDVKVLGSHADPLELKRMVGGFKEATQLNNNTTNSSNMKQTPAAKKKPNAIERATNKGFDELEAKQKFDHENDEFVYHHLNDLGYNSKEVERLMKYENKGELDKILYPVKTELKAPAHFSDKENERYHHYIPEDKYEYLGLFDNQEAIVPLKERAEKDGYRVFSSYDDWDRTQPEYHKFHAFKAREKDPGLPLERTPYGSTHLHELRYGTGFTGPHGALYNDHEFWNRYVPDDLHVLGDLPMESPDNPNSIKLAKKLMKNLSPAQIQETLHHLGEADKVLDRIVAEEMVEHNASFYAKFPFRSGNLDDQNGIKKVKAIIEASIKPSTSVSKPKPNSQSYTATSPAPRFRHLEDGSLSHNTKDGRHGAGNYNIKKEGEQYQISFTPKEGGVTRKIMHGKSLSHMKDMVRQYKLSEKQGPYIPWETEHENNRGEDDFSIDQLRNIENQIRGKIVGNNDPDDNSVSNEDFYRGDIFDTAAVWLMDTNKHGGNKSSLIESYEDDARDMSDEGNDIDDIRAAAYREVAQLIRDTKPDPISRKSDGGPAPVKIPRKPVRKPVANQNAIELERKRISDEYDERERKHGLVRDANGKLGFATDAPNGPPQVKKLRSKRVTNLKDINIPSKTSGRTSLDVMREAVSPSNPKEDSRFGSEWVKKELAEMKRMGFDASKPLGGIPISMVPNVVDLTDGKKKSRK